eukprot:scaffold3943_cov123-Isochrysis_galbana.AAC.2
MELPQTGGTARATFIIHLLVVIMPYFSDAGHGLAPTLTCPSLGVVRVGRRPPFGFVGKMTTKFRRFL